VIAPEITLTPRLDPVPVGIGVVAPHDLALDRELWRWTPEPVALYVTRTPPLDVEVSTELAEALRDEDALARACKEVAEAAPGVTAYLCTSASFVAGLAGETELRAVMERAGARRAITTSGALLEALAALGSGRVAVATPYDAELTNRLADFLEEAGHEVVSTARLGLSGNIWRVSAASVRELVHGLPLDGADAVVISCTNLPTYDVLPELEQRTGLPVVSANLATMWAALRAIGALPADRPERLFNALR
jgi:maleate isomerase